jgi:hypothetical protein
MAYDQHTGESTMKHFLSFIAGVVLASAIQAIVPVAEAKSIAQMMEQDRIDYRAYVACRDKNPTVVTYECLRMNPLGFKQL